MILPEMVVLFDNSFTCLVRSTTKSSSSSSPSWASRSQKREPHDFSERSGIQTLNLTIEKEGEIKWGQTFGWDVKTWIPTDLVPVH